MNVLTAEITPEMEALKTPAESHLDVWRLWSLCNVSGAGRAGISWPVIPMSQACVSWMWLAGAGQIAIPMSRAGAKVDRH